MKKSTFFTLLLLFITMGLYAGNGIITGKVLDEKGEPMIGATVMIDGTTIGSRTDLDGKFTLRNLDDGKYNLVVSYISYEKKTVTDVEVKGGTSDFVTITLEKAGKGLKEVVIKTQMKKESINALLIQQKNLTTISDGISAELIKKTPDRNTGDVLKRVSGVSIAENKFAIIRGLADRYNMAMLNGDILPSSEADRKAFSFDVFPSSLLENIVIIKAATPDRPGEFSGGIIDLSTKDIPTESFFNIQIGTGMNTISTFKPYSYSKKSSTDWLGFDKSVRIIPQSFPTTETFRKPLNEFTLADRVEASKKFENTWAVNQGNSMAPFANLQAGGGYVKNFKKDKVLGVLAAVSYSRQKRTYEVDRSDLLEKPAYLFHDMQHRDNVLVGSLFNVGFKFNNNHKITFKNTFTINADDQTVVRRGDFYDNDNLIKGSAFWYNNNQLLSNQLNSEHILTKHKIKLQLGVGRNLVTRTIPDLRRSIFTRNYDAPDSNFTPIIAVFPNPFFNGRFFATTKEYINSGNVDVTVPYNFIKGKHHLKAGAYIQSKKRNYDARVLAYVRAKTIGFDNSILTQPQEQIFSHDNIRDNGIILSDATLLTDSYEANSSLQAGYILSDNLFADKFRFVYGVRVENFEQNLITGNLVPGDLVVKKSNINFLPSLNFTYLLNKKTNIRFCASQTLSRPEFRELSPATFYDYNLSANFRGNPQLEQTTIMNYDLRYEYFLGKGEMISGSVFYKDFKNPIELSVPKGIAATQKVFEYKNAKQANLVGAELEFRKSLSWITKNEKSQWNNIVLFGNLAVIRSSVEVIDSTIGGESSYIRPMQGQSPYVINGGISYTHPKADFNTTIVFNRIGQRIFAIGNGEIPETYEAPRNVLDLSFTKVFSKKIEVKLTISDIISNPFVYYYNIDDKNRPLLDRNESGYNKQKDFEVINVRQGTNIGISVAYKLK